MTERVFGRTNLPFPSVWLSLRVPSERADGGIAGLVEAALASGAPLDVSSAPGLWGGAMRATEAVLMRLGAKDLARATGEEHAANLVRAHLIETLCAIGREHLDFYFLRFGDAPTEDQISGALSALEEARQEGHVRFLGLCAVEQPSAAFDVCRRHDAFEAILTGLPVAERTLAGLAQERRAGLLIHHSSLGAAEVEHANSPAAFAAFTHLIAVSSPDEVRRAVALGGNP